MKISEIKPDVYLATFSSQYLMASSFMRLQEFYESPYKEIRGKHFTVEEFMDIYARKTGGFDYFDDINGFNVPGKTVDAFIEEYQWKPLLDKEKAFLDAVLEAVGDKEDYYLISCMPTDTTTLKHELAHAYYYQDEDYALRMNGYVFDLSRLIRKKMANNLLRRGYSSDMMYDETQAYMSSWNYDDMKWLGMNRMFRVPRIFKDTFNKKNETGRAY